MVPLHTLKKANTSIHRDVWPVRIDVDDFYAIIHLLQENNCEGLRIEADGFVLDDPKDVERLGRVRITELCIKTSQPYLQITFSRHRATVYAGEDNALANGLVSRVCRIVDKYAFVRPLVRVYGVLMVNVYVASVYVPNWSRLLPRWAGLAFWSLYVALGLFLGILWFRSFILHVRPKHDNFVKRNKDRIDKLVIAVVSAIVGAIARELIKP